MEKIAFLTDSTSGIGMNDYNDVFVVPLGTIIGGKSYIDNIDISIDEFYELLRVRDDGAKSFQPFPQTIATTYQKIVNAGYTHVIAIHASSNLTGTYQQSKIASYAIDIESTVIDSKIGDYPLLRIIEEGRRYKKMGKSYTEIIGKVKDLVESAKLIIHPENLKQLQKSGRLSKSKEIFASLLNIQLVAEFNDGKVVPIKKLRSKKRAINYILERLKAEIKQDSPSRIGVSYAGDQKRADKIVEWLKEYYPQKVIDVNQLVQVAAVHTGYGTIAVSWIKDEH